MDKKAHEALERIRKDVTLTTSDLENQDAAEFFSELADWAYANGEAMLIDDEPPDFVIASPKNLRQRV